MELIVTVKSKTDNSVQNVKQPLNGKVLLGRGPEMSIPLDGTGISREHLAIDHENSALFVTDLSSNGTWINGNRMQRGRRSRVGEEDAIELPGYEIHVRIAGAGEGGPVAVASGAAAQPARMQEVRAEAGKKRSSVRAILGSVTALEKFVILIAILSFWLLLTYLSF